MKKITLITLNCLFLIGLTSCGSVSEPKNDRSKIDKNYQNFMDRNQGKME